MKPHTNQPRIEGNYFLTGVHEIASVLVLKPDHTSNFLYTYGAVDRTGRGGWKIALDDSTKVVLCSKSRPVADFALVKKTITPDDHTLIRISDRHPGILRHITVRLHTRHGIKDKFTDAQGTVLIERQPLQKIELMFELYPDRFSCFDIGDQRLSHFEFRFEPWITDIFFENLTIAIGHNRLTTGYKGLVPAETPMLLHDDVPHSTTVPPGQHFTSQTTGGTGLTVKDNQVSPG